MVARGREHKKKKEGGELDLSPLLFSSPRAATL
jgi:hypothetical protein